MIKLSFYEIKKSITFSAILLILLSDLVLFLYSLSFSGVVYPDGDLYGLLRGYEKATGERGTLLGSDAESALMEFYTARIDIVPSGGETFFVEGDDAGLAIESYFSHEKYLFDDSQSAEIKKLIGESDSLFTANLMENFHWTMFWATVFVLTAIAMMCAFTGRKEEPSRAEIIGSTLHGKNTEMIGFSAALICSLAAIVAGIFYVIIRELNAICAGAMAENIYGRYAFELSYNTGSMSFGVYVALAMVTFALFSFACAAFNDLISVLLGGGTAVFAVIPAEVLLQSFIAKLVWLNGFELDWQPGGATGFLFGGGGGRYETLDFKLIIPVIAACFVVLFAGNLLVFGVKGRLKRLIK